MCTSRPACWPPHAQLHIPPYPRHPSLSRSAPAPHPHPAPHPPHPPPQVKSGNDDLRQDAVMQQFFWLVNQFLAEQPRTQRRSLFIRTYKVGWGRVGCVCVCVVAAAHHTPRGKAHPLPGLAVAPLPSALPVASHPPAPPLPAPQAGGPLQPLLWPAGVGGAHAAAGRLPAGGQPHGGRARALQAPRGPHLVRVLYKGEAGEPVGQGRAPRGELGLAGLAWGWRRGACQARCFAFCLPGCLPACLHACLLQRWHAQPLPAAALHARSW